MKKKKKQAVAMSDDVAMTTGGLSVQPGFGVFRQAAPRRFEVFNLLSGRKQAAVLDGVNGAGGAGRERG